MADAPDADAESAEHYGNLLLAANRPIEAAGAYEKSRDLLGADAGWAIWLQIGSAYDKAGRWPLAQAALERAVALGPDQAVGEQQARHKSDRRHRKDHHERGDQRRVQRRRQADPHR